MKISTRARYGTRAMLDLALHYGKGAVMVKDIAERQQISTRYLEQLLLSLKIAGMVSSARGMGGGFSLSKAPSQIKLIDIVQVLEGPICPVRCVDEPSRFCRSPYCVARDIWVEIKEAANRVLESVTLEDLVNKHKKKEKLAARKGKSAIAKMKSKCGEDSNA